MINIYEVNETNKMIEKENLDVRTITMGISLLDCADSDLEKVKNNIYNKITTVAKDLVKTGQDIEKEFGIPIVNKRISITPIAMVGQAACKTSDDYVEIAKVLDKAAHEVGVNFIGGYSAVVSKGMTRSDELLIRSIPRALAETELICSSVNVGSTKTGINMDAVRLLGDIIKETAEYTKDNDSLGCAKFVALCNAPDDNPFMAGAFHGVSEADVIINVGVSGPGVVKYALSSIREADFEVLCETIKKTAFKITRVGQLVAQEASKRLGVPFYGKEIIQMASDESGIDVKLFGQVEEGTKVKASLFNKTGLYKGALIAPDQKGFISDENIFNYQAKVVNDLAEKEPCVIVGRCVNYVFRDRPNTLRVFIHAPWEFRVEKSREKISGGDEEIEKFLRKDDKRKQDYYRKFAGGDWSDATNYDLCLNSGKLGFEKCVDAILAQMEVMGIK